MSDVSIIECISVIDIGKLRGFRSQDFLTFLSFHYHQTARSLLYSIRIYSISVLANKRNIEDRFLHELFINRLEADEEQD